MPRLRGQRWSCHSCSDCCRTPVQRVTREECERIDKQHWGERLGVARALAIVDRAATGLPAWGTMAERARVTFLFADDGIARLANEYSSMGEDQ